MASATLSAAVLGTSTSALEERGVGEPRRHAEGPKVVAAVIAAAMHSSMRLTAIGLMTTRARGRTIHHVSPSLL
jgi:hypothetical protein